MLIKHEVSNIYDLENMLWSGAKSHFQDLIALGWAELFLEVVENIWPDGVELTTLNDWLWFEFDTVKEILNPEDL